MRERPAPRPFFDAEHGALLISHAGETTSAISGGTMPAYRRVATRGCRAFQVDVVPTVDGQLLSIHAVFGRRPALERGTLSAARERAGPDVPTLRELLHEFPDARWNIEIKSRRCEAALVTAIEEHPRRDLLCVSAPFHTRVLRRIRTRFPDLATNASLLEGALVGVNLLPWRPVSGDAIQLMNMLGVGPIVRRNVRRDRVVHVWTVNDPARAAELVDLGVAGIVTDEFAALHEALTTAPPGAERR